MKPLLTVLLLAFVLSLHAQDKNEQSIRKLLSHQVAEWNKGNIEGYMKGYWESDSLLFIGKNGVKHGYTNTLQNYKKGYPDTTAMGKLAFELLKIQQISANAYFVVGKWMLKRSIGDLSGHYTLLIRKINNQWVIVADHSS